MSESSICRADEVVTPGSPLLPATSRSAHRDEHSSAARERRDDCDCGDEDEDDDEDDSEEAPPPPPPRSHSFVEDERWCHSEAAQSLGRLAKLLQGHDGEGEGDDVDVASDNTLLLQECRRELDRLSNVVKVQYEGLRRLALVEQRNDALLEMGQDVAQAKLIAMQCAAKQLEVENEERKTELRRLHGAAALCTCGSAALFQYQILIGESDSS